MFFIGTVVTCVACVNFFKVFSLLHFLTVYGCAQ